MKKLLFITDMYPNEVNPVYGIFVQQQVEELSKFYSVKVIATTAYSPNQFQSKTLQLNDFMVHYLNSPMNKVSFFFSIFDYFRVVIPEIRKIINTWKPDMIHVHDCRHVPELFCLRNELDKFKINSYLTIHNIKSHPRNITNAWSRPLYGLTMLKAYSNWKHIFTVNDKLKDDILRYIDADKITVLQNGISEFTLTESDFVTNLKSKFRQGSYRIISVGNLVREKGFDLLIEAVKILNLDEHNIQLVIVGSGPDHDYLTQLIKTENLERDIALIPQQSNVTVRNLYPIFDSFILPSYRESFGIVYLEAMYAQLPVIGVKGQGIDGTISDGKNGLLVKPQDVDDLVDKIKQLMKNPDQAKAIATSGEKTVRDSYMLTTIINKIQSIYEME